LPQPIIAIRTFWVIEGLQEMKWKNVGTNNRETVRRINGFASAVEFLPTLLSIQDVGPRFRYK
jgi:hypothetical protein